MSNYSFHSYKKEKAESSAVAVREF